MVRQYLMALLALCGSAVFALGLQSPQTSEEKAEFQWLESSGSTTGIQYATHQLQPMSPQIKTGPPVDIEREEKQIDALTRRVTSRVYGTSVSGERRVLETIVEDIKKMPDGAVSAVRTTSRRDINGRMSVAQKETQEVVASGTDSYRITKTLLLPGIDKTLVEKEHVQQIERRKGENSVEIDRTRYELGADGKWTAIERSVSQNSLNKEQTQTSERVYRYDANRRMSLAQQVNTREWKDAAGQTHLRSEVFTAGMDGKLQLDSRITMVQTAEGAQKQETTEVVERPNPAAPSEGVRVVEKIVENKQTLGAGKTERQLEVFKPNLNGGMELIHSQQTIDVK